MFDETWEKINYIFIYNHQLVLLGCQTWSSLQKNTRGIGLEDKTANN